MVQLHGEEKFYHWYTRLTLSAKNENLREGYTNETLLMCLRNRVISKQLDEILNLVVKKYDKRMSKDVSSDECPVVMFMLWMANPVVRNEFFEHPTLLGRNKHVVVIPVEELEIWRRTANHVKARSIRRGTENHSVNALVDLRASSSIYRNEIVNDFDIKFTTNNKLWGKTQICYSKTFGIVCRQELTLRIRELQIQKGENCNGYNRSITYHKKRYIYILAIHDYCSNFTITIPVEKIFSDEVWLKFKDEFPLKFAMTLTFHTDMGIDFRSELFKCITNKLGDNYECDTVLKIATFSYNVYTHKSTVLSPFDAMQKRFLYLPIYSYFESETLEVFKHAPVHYCTDFTSTSIATVFTYGRDIRCIDPLKQAVRGLRGSHPLNTHPYPQTTRPASPDHHSFAGTFEYPKDQYDECRRLAWDLQINEAGQAYFKAGKIAENNLKDLDHAKNSYVLSADCYRKILSGSAYESYRKFVKGHTLFAINVSVEYGYIFEEEFGNIDKANEFYNWADDLRRKNNIEHICKYTPEHTKRFYTTVLSSNNSEEFFKLFWHKEQARNQESIFTSNKSNMQEMRLFLANPRQNIPSNMSSTFLHNFVNIMKEIDNACLRYKESDDQSTKIALEERDNESICLN
ncbi:hypothetical protein RF11_04904 [Thelohanellus kitauei]|uniref:Uncharacterized protein n=1 Tax=Thelohanellus kitauei TaxID=669202 RepID=A0A0C2J2J7_THEKT|nr:hypothetical protein RF11_04904 [Thelohanellus kitauei]